LEGLGVGMVEQLDGTGFDALQGGIGIAPRHVEFGESRVKDATTVVARIGEPQAGERLGDV